MSLHEISRGALWPVAAVEREVRNVELAASSNSEHRLQGGRPQGEEERSGLDTHLGKGRELVERHHVEGGEQTLPEIHEERACDIERTVSASQVEAGDLSRRQ